eukprot:Hpha_TRINITY_DN1851_c0_g1::TRINITY_DN1851_c0_g1_i1::g.170544::m.170544
MPTRSIRSNVRKIGVEQQPELYKYSGGGGRPSPSLDFAGIHAIKTFGYAEASGFSGSQSSILTGCRGATSIAGISPPYRLSEETDEIIRRTVMKRGYRFDPNPAKYSLHYTEDESWVPTLPATRYFLKAGKNSNIYIMYELLRRGEVDATGMEDLTWGVPHPAKVMVRPGKKEIVVIKLPFPRKVHSTLYDKFFRLARLPPVQLIRGLMLGATLYTSDAMLMDESLSLVTTPYARLWRGFEWRLHGGAVYVRFRAKDAVEIPKELERTPDESSTQKSHYETAYINAKHDFFGWARVRVGDGHIRTNTKRYKTWNLEEVKRIIRDDRLFTTLRAQDPSESTLVPNILFSLPNTPFELAIQGVRKEGQGDYLHPELERAAEVPTSEHEVRATLKAIIAESDGDLRFADLLEEVCKRRRWSVSEDLVAKVKTALTDTLSKD